MRKQTLVAIGLGLAVLVFGLAAFFYFTPSQECKFYLTFKKEAEQLPTDKINTDLDVYTKSASTSDSNWARFSAYFIEWEKRNGLHDQTEWDKCN